MKKSSEDEKIMWHQLVENHLKFSQSLKEFFAKDVDRVTLIRNAMQRGELASSFYVLEYMQTSEVVQLFEELVKFSLLCRYSTCDINKHHG